MISKEKRIAQNYDELRKDFEDFLVDQWFSRLVAEETYDRSWYFYIDRRYFQHCKENPSRWVKLLRRFKL